VTPTWLPRGTLLAAVAGLVVPLAACTSSGDPSGASGGPARSPSAAAPTAAALEPNRPFGQGCAQLPATGPGSVAAVAAVPAVTAASTVAQLSTLVQAVTTASLVDTLNSTQNITVLAPANTAFQAVPADRLRALMADTAQLTAVLTHHVLAGRLGPDRLTGQLTTLDNDRITLTGSGADLTVSGDQTLSGQPAHVVCGNIQTANATVYVVDQVLKPQNFG
jgi:uncharacterized surface protein with fasciclin (FAS1) repeats